ncbi:MAG: capsular biosynthesis protein [Bacteroidetes bacterium]|nr:capsular biosynthesis protein [Bacteroidota bacterium]
MSIINKLLGKDRRLKNPVPIPVKTDIHSHLIPGIDDGSQSLEESIHLIKKLYQLGYRKIITTPHIMGDHFRNNTQIITDGLKIVQDEVAKQGIDVVLEAASEYYIDDHFMKLLEKDDILSFGDRYVLVETNAINYTELIRNAFWQMGLSGYKPIFAHPERYSYLWNDFDRYHEFHDMGIFLQINLVSLSGFYSQKVKEIAERLIDENLVSFIGTDTHEMRYIEGIHESLHSPYMNKLKDMKLLNDTL